MRFFSVMNGKNNYFCKSCSKTDSFGLAEVIHSLLSCALCFWIIRQEEATTEELGA